MSWLIMACAPMTCAPHMMRPVCMYCRYPYCSKKYLPTYSTGLFQTQCLYCCNFYIFYTPSYIPTYCYEL